MLSILLAVMVAGSTGTPTNLEMAEQVVGQAVTPLADSLCSNGFRSISIEMVGDNPADWLVEQTARSVFSSFGVAVSAADRTAPEGTTLRLRTMEMAVTLGSAGRSWVFGARRVNRIVRCEVSAEVVGQDGTVERSWRSSSDASDRVHQSDLASLQGSSGQEWLTGGTPSASGGGVLEPLVVTGVVASLIYLFYSSRTQ